MSLSKSIRQIHRWLSFAFMVTVIITFFLLQQESPPEWANYLALPPLFALMLSGVYLFALPYASKWRKNS